MRERVREREREKEREKERERKREREREREKERERKRERERERERVCERVRERQRERETVSNASLFCGTLEPTRMRWECGQVRVTRLRKGSNCAVSATVSSLCTDQHSPSA